MQSVAPKVALVEVSKVHHFDALLGWQHLGWTAHNTASRTQNNGPIPPFPSLFKHYESGKKASVLTEALSIKDKVIPGISIYYCFTVGFFLGFIPGASRTKWVQ